MISSGDFVTYGFTFVLVCAGILALTIAAHIPEWTEIDRAWKLGDDDGEAEREKPLA